MILYGIIQFWENIRFLFLAIVTNETLSVDRTILMIFIFSYLVRINSGGFGHSLNILISCIQGNLIPN